MTSALGWEGVRVYTIGHSTRSLEELVALLSSFGIRVLADIRTIPRSRKNPQFNRDALPDALAPAGMRYAHLSRLGGLRRPRPDSENGAWRNLSFRGYADHMQTPEFEAGIAELRALATAGPVAIMCAEAVPWRCHRSLVADALLARGGEVEHISGVARSSTHRMPKFARRNGSRVTYPSDEAGSDRLEVSAPFHLQATVRILQRWPTNLVDLWEEGRYLRLLPLSGQLTLVEVENRGSVDAPDVRYRLRHGAPTREERVQLATRLRAALGLDVDLAPVERLAAADRRLRVLARRLRGMRPPRFCDLFEAFASVIPFQQVSLDSGAAVVRRLVERFGARLEHADRTYHAFPSAEAVAGARMDALRRCGLSAQKAESLRGIARRIASGELTEAALRELPSEAARKVLLALPGIGPWSANLVLLRGLGRLDVFPPGDVGARRELGALLGLAPGASLDPAVARLGSYRGYLYFCALGSKLLAKGLIQSAPSGRQ